MGFSCKIFQKGKTMIIPTISTHLNKVMFPNFQAGNFNKTFALNYLSPLLKEENVPQLANLDVPLIKLELEVQPNFQSFFELIKKIRSHHLLYIRMLSDQYLHLRMLVENQNEFSNFIVTIENEKLAEEELMQLYKYVNKPIQIGMTLSNICNFSESETETAMRRYFKQMFQFRDQVKILEFNFKHLVELFEGLPYLDSFKSKESTDLHKISPEKENPKDQGFLSKLFSKKPAPEGKKKANLQTLIDFSLVTEFRGFLDIVFEKSDYHYTAQEELFINQAIASVEQLLLSQNFHILTITDKEELNTLIN